MIKLRKLSECQLYGILDLSYVDNSEALPVAEGMIKGGVDLIQLRGKERPIEELVDLAAALHELTVRSSTPLIVNDHAEVAVKVPVEGVHVGQNEVPKECGLAHTCLTDDGDVPAAVLGQDSESLTSIAKRMKAV